MYVQEFPVDIGEKARPYLDIRPTSFQSIDYPSSAPFDALMTGSRAGEYDYCLGKTSSSDCQGILLMNLTSRPS